MYLVPIYIYIIHMYICISVSHPLAFSENKLCYFLFRVEKCMYADDDDDNDNVSQGCGIVQTLDL